MTGKLIDIVLNVITSGKDSYNCIIWSYNDNHQENKNLKLKCKVLLLESENGGVGGV